MEAQEGEEMKHYGNPMRKDIEAAYDKVSKKKKKTKKQQNEYDQMLNVTGNTSGPKG